MKLVEMVGHQGDVVIFKVDEFPTGERVQDELTKNNQVALGEFSGHNHCFDDAAAVDMFKVNDARFAGLTFVETKKPAVLRHGLIKGYQGKEADQDYHSELTLPSGEKYVMGIVQETDWITKTIRKVVD